MALRVSLIALLAMAAVGVYLAPALIAVARRADRAELVLAVNALLGWTLVGWVGAMLLATRARQLPTGPPAPGAAARPALGQPRAEAWPLAAPPCDQGDPTVPQPPWDPSLN